MCKIIAFHGADHKAGVTMIAQAIAEKIATEQGVRVLFLVLNGRVNNQYFGSEIKSVDDFKLQLESKLLNPKDFARDCRYKGNLHVLGGPNNEIECRYYFPDEIIYLVETVKEEFDLILMDTGESLDCGLAIGGLQEAEKRYLVMTQEEVGIARYERQRSLYERMAISFDEIIINKFIEHDSYTKGYMAERIGVGKDKIFCVDMSNKGREAERERKSLFELKSESFLKGLEPIAKTILTCCGIAGAKNQRKNRIWKSFI